ncbi:MAG: hypothetical protein V7709_09990 [Halioglobus sp.]
MKNYLILRALGGKKSHDYTVGYRLASRENLFHGTGSYLAWLPPAGIFITIACYGAFLFAHAINIPFADDILDVLQVINGLVNSDDAATKADLLFAQHNDHRTLSSRLIYYLVFSLEGEVNFRSLTFVANFALVLIFALWYLSVRDHSARWLILLPVALILFQLRAYGITLWSMAAFAYFYVYLYGFASLYCLGKKGTFSFVAALVLASLATFTLASGQMVWFIGLAALLHQAVVLKRRSIVLPVLWFVATVFVMLAWRAGLETPNSMSHVLGLLWETPVHHLFYYFALLGSAVSESSVVAAVISGAVMVLVLAGSTVYHFRVDNLQLELFGWFICLSVFAMVLGRAPYSDIEYALSSRYSFPSILLLSNTFLIVAYRADRRFLKLVPAVVLLALIYCFTSYRLYSVALQPYMEKRVDNFNRKNYWVFGKPKKETNPIVQESISMAVYAPPARPFPQPKIALVPAVEE